MSRPGEKFCDDLKVVIGIDLVGRKDAVLVTGLEDGDWDHQIAGKLESVGLCEGEIVRHFGGSIWSGPIPADGSSKDLERSRSPSGAAERSQLASEPPVG